jgi:hypothetical protein
VVAFVMLFAAGIFMGGTYSFARNKRWFGAIVMAIASVLALAGAWAWSR